MLTVRPRRRPVRFHANHMSGSEDGDYYQVMFEAREDAGNPESPYLIIQRQFEDPDGGLCYVETHDEKYIGHFRVRRIDLSSTRIVLEIDRPEANVVEVTFGMASSDFESVARVVGIITGAIDPL